MTEFEISSRAKLPKPPRKAKTPPNVAEAMKAYQAQCKRVYGLTPEARYDAQTKFIHMGKSGGVKLSRLKQLIVQLQNTEVGAWAS